MQGERKASSGPGRDGGAGAQPAGRKPRRRTGGRKTGDTTPKNVVPVVGIGASAGGLEAFADLLEHLPADTGMAFVLVQHLAPTHKTILPEILSRSTSMPVDLATDGVELQPNRVYICPPAQDITVSHGSLRLSEREAVAGMHLPVDHFMRSLAEDQKSKAIGIVLSGSASDGVLGLSAIKAEGGITLAQEPSSARYDGMPTAAIRANAADKVLDTAGIARELARLGKHPYVLEEEPEEAARAPEIAQTDADWMNKIYVLLRTVFGVDFSTYRITTVRRRIDRRMALYRLDSLKEYVAYLRERPAEVEDLYHDILIMVTEFFREPEAFEALATAVLPEAIAGKSENEQLRIWVPGCSTGEEPYSIALTVVRAMQQAGRDLPVKIFATDISERDIEQARLGIFPENKYASVPEQYKHYFNLSDGGHQISKSIRDLVIFARHDVIADPPFSQLDLISCRNLLIYLGQSAQERVIPTFHYALRPQGYLMLGGSESVGSSTDLFAPVDKKLKIYVKKPSSRRAPALMTMPTFGQDPSSPLAFAPLAGYERRFDPQHAAEEILLNEFAPPAIVIDDEFEIMQFRGGTDEFLQHATGRASLNALEMAREGLAAEVRKAVDKARVGDKPVQRDPVRYRSAGELREVSVQAMPFKGSAGERYYVVLFRRADGEGVRPLRTAESSLPSESSEVVQLQRELDATRDYMQALVQDKEAALEELRAANEEIQSSNEELQSMNEELETAKEELQSTNEELRTVNEELENRNLQLSRTNDDLSNLLRAVNVPTIMVGRDQRIRRFTLGAERVMNLIATDIGRPITDIALRLDVPDLGDMLGQAIENIAVAEREIRDEHGHWYSMRVRPYQTDQNRIEGAVITLFDVDELRNMLAKVRQAAELNEGVNKLLSVLQTDRPLERTMLVVLAEGAAAVGAEAAAVLLRHDDGWVVRHGHNVAPDVPGRRFSDEEMPQATIAQSTRAPVAARSGEGSSRLLPDGFGDTAIVAVPLIEGTEVSGVLLMAWKSDGSTPDEAQVDFVAKVGALTALALKHSSR